MIARAFAVLLLLAGPAAAIEPEQVEAVVYRLNSFDGFEHVQGASPPEADELVMIAGTRNLVDPRQTFVYYWPLSRSFYSAWDRLDLPLSGTLEIAADEDEIVATLTRERVALAYRAGVGGGDSVVVTGAEADEAKAFYDRVQHDFNRMAQEAARARARYEEAVRQSFRGGPSPGPAPPPAPPAPKLYVTDIRQAFVVDLPAGRYRLRLRQDGRIVEGSERKLTVVAPSEAGAVTWQVIPEERWTRRLALEHPDSAVYAAAGSALYLVPFRADAYDARDMARLANPQATLPAPSDRWVIRQPILGARLEARSPAETSSSDWAAYTIVQTGGSDLGYRIVPASGTGASDLFAFSLALPKEAAGETLALALLDAKTGAPIAGSDRPVHIVAPHRLTIAWVTAALPLAIGLTLLLRRWLRRRPAFD